MTLCKVSKAEREVDQLPVRTQNWIIIIVAIN